MNDSSSYQEEGDDDSGPILVPFPSRTRPRTSSRPLPDIPHPPTDYPLPPSSALYPIPHTFSTSFPLSHKLSAASAVSASHANGNKLLRSQPSLQALYTPTPTTPSVIERTWTRKMSIWPPPVLAGDDPFAANPPWRETPKVTPPSLHVHVAAPFGLAGRDSMAFAGEEMTNEEQITPIAVTNVAASAQIASPMVDDLPDSPASTTSTVASINGHHDLHDGWTEICAPSTTSLNTAIIIKPPSPIKANALEQPATPKSLMKRRGGSIRARWRSIARRTLVSEEVENPPKKRKGSSASHLSNKAVHAADGMVTVGAAELVHAAVRSPPAPPAAAASDDVSDPPAAAGQAVPVTEAISLTSVGGNEDTPSTATDMPQATTASESTTSSICSAVAVEDFPTTSPPVISSPPPIPARSPARPCPTAPLTIPIPASPSSLMRDSEPFPTPASARPATPTSIKSNKSKRLAYLKLFIDTGSASNSCSSVRGFGAGTSETVATAGHGSGDSIVSHRTSQFVDSSTPPRNSVALPVEASSPVNVRVGSTFIETPMSSPSVYTPSLRSAHFPDPDPVSGSSPPAVPTSTSSNVDVSASAEDSSSGLRTRRSSMTTSSTYTSHSHYSTSSTSSPRPLSLSSSSVFTESTAATSLQSRGQSQVIPSSAHRQGSSKLDEHGTNEVACMPPVPETPAGVLPFSGEQRREQQLTAEGTCTTGQLDVKKDEDGENLPTPKPLPTAQCPWASTSGSPNADETTLPYCKGSQTQNNMGGLPSSPSFLPNTAGSTAIPRRRQRSRTELNTYPSEQNEWRFSRNSAYAAFDAFLKDSHRSSLDLSLAFPTSSTITSTQPTTQVVDFYGDAECEGDENARVRARIISLATSQMSPYAIAVPSAASLLASTGTLPWSSRHALGTHLHDVPCGNDNKLMSKLTKPAKGMEKVIEVKKQRSIAKLEQEAFRESDELCTADVYRAAQLDVLNTKGEKVRFGNLFEDNLAIVCFIRHFWCPHCQDYMRSIVDNAPKDALDRAGVKLIIIGCGSPAMAKAYKESVFQLPYDIYVDPTRALYRALGMTRRTTDSGAQEDKGDYVVHGSVSGIGMVLKNALKMPLGNPGDMKQLGGEFLLGPGVRSDYCHRMSTTRGHTSIRKLLRLANVDPSDAKRQSTTASEAPSTLGMGTTPSLPRPVSGSSSFITPLPPRLEVHIDNSTVRQRKDTWDEFIRWTHERRLSGNLLVPTEACTQETYSSYAPSADQHRDMCTKRGGPCGDGDMTACCFNVGRAHQNVVF